MRKLLVYETTEPRTRKRIPKKTARALLFDIAEYRCLVLFLLHTFYCNLR